MYYLTPDRKKVIRVISDMVRPNGVIGTPNGRRLYVADHGREQDLRPTESTATARSPTSSSSPSRAPTA